MHVISAAAAACGHAAEHAVQEVAEAIYESVLPRSASDAVPATPAGIVVACADRIDSLVGLTAVGALPSASADPFGMRRTAYGLLQTLIRNSVRVSLRDLVELSIGGQAIDVDAACADALLTFCSKRLEQLLLDRGASLPVSPRATCAADPLVLLALLALLIPDKGAACASHAPVQPVLRVLLLDRGAAPLA